MTIRERMMVSSARGGGRGNAQGVFLAPQSLTFPGAAAVITLILQILSVPFAAAHTSFWWALSLSAVIGAVITFSTWDSTMNPKQKSVAITVAVLNVLLLTGTALGIGSTATGTPVHP